MEVQSVLDIQLARDANAMLGMRCVLQPDNRQRQDEDEAENNARILETTANELVSAGCQHLLKTIEAEVSTPREKVEQTLAPGRIVRGTRCEPSSKKERSKEKLLREAETLELYKKARQLEEKSVAVWRLCRARALDPRPAGQRAVTNVGLV